MTTPTTESKAMTDAEYRAGMDLVAAAVKILLSAPIDQLRDNLAKVETLAPILEPTAYQRGGGDRLHEQRRILDAATKLCETARELASTGDPGCP